MKLLDSHAHYGDERYDEDREELLNKFEKEFKLIINSGYNLESSNFSVDLAKKYDYIYASCGISPNDVTENYKNEIEELEKIASNSKVVAIGEIGLDYYWNKENKQIQKEAFIEQIKLANKLNLPIVIHTREAIMDTIDIIKNIQTCDKKGVFHCCPLNIELVKEAIKLGYYISFSGNITFKSSKNADKVISYVPMDKILIETDSPYLTPEPYRGRRNDSGKVIEVAKKIAEVKGVELEEIAEITIQNAINIYNI